MRRPARDKKIWISGASSGLGEALAMSLARRGAFLVLGARRLNEVRRVAEACRRFGAAGAWAGRLDQSSPASVKSFVRSGLKASGGIDAVVANAGVHAFGRVGELSEKNFRRVIEVNLLGSWRLVKELLAPLREAKGQVVLVSSAWSLRGGTGAAAYSASKAALERMAEALRDEEAAFDVSVLTARPGVIVTPLRANALVNGAAPKTAGLRWARDPVAVAEQIVDAMEADKARVFPAAWQIRLALGLLAPLAPGLLDRFLKNVDSRTDS